MADSFDARMFEQMRLLCGEQNEMIQSLRRLVSLLEKQIREFPATACELQDKVTALEIRLAAIDSARAKESGNG